MESMFLNQFHHPQNLFHKHCRHLLEMWLIQASLVTVGVNQIAFTIDRYVWKCSVAQQLFSSLPRKRNWPWINHACISFVLQRFKRGQSYLSVLGERFLDVWHSYNSCSSHGTINACIFVRIPLTGLQFHTKFHGVQQPIIINQV